MKFLSKKDLFGSGIPKAYVNKITLESQGYNTPPKNSNPHVDTGNQFEQREEQGIALSPAELGMASSPQSLTVTLDLVVKDILKNVPGLQSLDLVFDGTTASKLSGERLDIRNYIKLNVVQCTSPTMAETFINSARTIPTGAKHEEKYLSEIIESNAGGTAVDETIRDQNMSLAVKDIPYKMKFDEWNTSGDDIPFSPDYLAYFVWTEFDVEKIGNDFNFQRRAVDVGGLNLSDLLRGINFRSKLTFDRVIENSKIVENGFVYRSTDGALWLGDVRDMGAENYWTLQDRGVYSNEGIWLKDDGTVWNEHAAFTYAHHQMPDGRWMTTNPVAGAYGSPGNGSGYITRQIVRKETVRNTKIQDFRGVERLEKINLNFAYIENNLMNNILESSRILSSFKTGGSNKYFTDMYLTRDGDNNCRFFFGFRKDKILEDFSVLRALYRKNNPRLLGLADVAEIFSMKIFRVRTKGSPEIGSRPTRPHRPYSFGTRNPLKFNNQNEYQNLNVLKTDDPSNAPNLDTISGDEFILKLTTDVNGNESIIPIDNVSELALTAPIFSVDVNGNSQDNITYFSGTDKSIKDKSDGYYQYRIELEIEDPAGSWLWEQYQTLNNIKKDLAAYFEDASRLGTTKIKNFTDNPHIENENLMGFQEGGAAVTFAPGDTRPGNFNVALNRFTREFIEHALAKDEYVPTNGDLELWNRVALTYMNVINNIAPNSLTQLEAATLHNYIHPETGNPNGILTVLKLIERLENILLRTMKGLYPVRAPNRGDPNHLPENAFKSIGGGAVLKSSLENTHRRRTSAKVEHQFDSTFNANLPKNVGMDILGFQAGNGNLPLESGIRIVGKLDFEEIVRREKKKIFKESDVPIQSFDFTQPVFSYDLNTSAYSYFTPSIVKTPMRTFDLRPVIGGEPEPPPAWSWAAARDETRRNIETAGNISSPLSSFMASHYNSIVVPEPEPTIPLIKPGAPPARSDQLNAAGENEEWLKRNSEYRQNQKKSTAVLSELLDDIAMPTDIDDIGKLAMRKVKKDLELYDQNNTDGYFSNLTPVMIERAGTTHLVAATAITSQIWNPLPNQVKALFTLANSGPAGSIPTVFTKAVERLKSDGFWSTDIDQAKTRYKFESIYVLEYFSGWENITEGNNQRAPADQPALLEKQSPATVDRFHAHHPPGAWRPLTKPTLDTTVDKLLFCRLREYNNSKVGIEFESELPIFEQYFLLNTSDTIPQAVPALRQAPPSQTYPAAQFASEYVQTDNVSYASRFELGADSGDDLGSSSPARSDDRVSMGEYEATDTTEGFGGGFRY